MIYSNILFPVISALTHRDAEQAHRWAIDALRWTNNNEAALEILRNIYDFEHPALERTFCDIKFRNPLGLAAGFDKNGEAPNTWEALGFGFVEIGTVLPRPQAGNPRPRLFRLTKDKALINRMGFNSAGAREVQRNLFSGMSLGEKHAIPLGINVSKQKETPLEEAHTDCMESMEILRRPASFYTANPTSPNTPDLRKLQEVEHLESFVAPLDERRKALDWQYHDGRRFTPLFVKLDPDKTPEQYETMLPVLAKYVDGLVVSNTTVDHSGLTSRYRDEIGGVSGHPLYTRVRDVRRFIRARWDRALVAAGGLCEVWQILEALRDGCELVELLTGFVYRGPELVKTTKKAIVVHI